MVVSMNKKDLVDLIKKTAQQLEDAPGVPAKKPSKNPPATTATQYGSDFSGTVQDTPTGVPTMPAVRSPSQPTSAPTAGASQGNKEIATMQKALVSLANEVTAQISPEGQSTDINTPQGSRRAGRDSFADFLAKTYMRNGELGSKAVEFSPDPNKTKVPEKEPRDPSKMSWVMDTMQRIGGEKRENVVDGKWGPRTNAALHNICAFAGALFALADAFHVQQNAYSQSELENLTQAMRPKDTDFKITEKIDLAGLITTHINAIKTMYQLIRKQVLEKPEYKDYIEGVKPYLTHGSFEITPQELEVIGKQYPKGWFVPIKTDKGVTTSDVIHVNDISSIENLKRWIESEESKTDYKYKENAKNPDTYGNPYSEDVTEKGNSPEYHGTGQVTTRQNNLGLTPYGVLQSIKEQISGGGK